MTETIYVERDYPKVARWVIERESPERDGWVFAREVSLGITRSFPPNALRPLAETEA